MPRSKQQFEEIRQATRDKIHKAACTVFARKGLSGANVQEIADLAQISVGLLYRHYRSKEALFNELVDYASWGLVEAVAAFKSDEPPKELAEGFCAQIVEDLGSGSEFAEMTVFLAQAFISGDDAGISEGLIGQNMMMIDAFAELIRRGQGTGDFRPGPANEMAALFFSAIQGLAVMKVTRGSEFRAPSVAVLMAVLY